MWRRMRACSLCHPDTLDFNKNSWLKKRTNINPDMTSHKIYFDLRILPMIFRLCVQ